MKQFLIKSSFFGGLFVLLHVLAAYYAEPNVDEFYPRFASDKQNALIIGSSRSAQGIAPEVLGKELKVTPYNFSFTIFNSPYGPTYIRAIKRKLKEGASGPFIIEVNPWVLSLNKEEQRTGEFREQKGRLGSQYTFSGRPNLEYLVKNYEYGWAGLMMPEWRNPKMEKMYVNHNGRLVVTIDRTEEERQAALLSKMRQYLVLANDNVYSKAREEYLFDLVAHLEERGEVYLVRMPIDDRVKALENDVYPDFDERMQSASDRFNVHYLNYTDSASVKGLLFNDGHHLTRKAGEEFTKVLTRSLR